MLNAAMAVMHEWAGIVGPATHILLIWLLAWLLLRSLRRALSVFVRHIHIENKAAQEGEYHEVQHDFRRIDTLANVFRYTANVVIFGMAVLLTLGEIGISITPILATAGVAGIAVGFGAQSLVKDFFSGLFLLLENQVSEGDLIEAAGKAGYVERVTLRHIRIRDYDGSVHFIPNGMITTVTNKSREYAFAVVDINVARHQHLDHVFALMREVSESMRKDASLGCAILDDIDIAGVEKLEDAAVTLRCRLKVRTPRQWRVRREFLRRMKLALDADGAAATSGSKNRAGI